MFGLFKPKKELDYKSQHISIMYLSQTKTRLEKQLESGERMGESEIFCAEHDIACIEKTIEYLEKG